jgi:TusA-related sulfurtransferase
VRGRLIAISIQSPMEINLKEIVWPVNVIQCNEALAQLEPGDYLTITVSDLDVIDNIVMLIKSRPDLEFDQSRENEEYRIRVCRQTKSSTVA